MRNHNLLAELSWFVLAVLLLLCLASAVCISSASAQEPVACSKVCSKDCGVKVDWINNSWQYDEDQNDGTVVITGTDRIVYWQAASGHFVSGVCVKAGQQPYFVIPEGEERWAGSWATPDQDISHVVVCTERPTAVGLAGLQATAASGDWKHLLVAASVSASAGFVIGFGLAGILRKNGRPR